MLLAEGAATAGLFTRNRFCAAPVLVCREHLAAGPSVRAIAVNTGNANAGTGERGLADARAVCAEVARLTGVGAQQVLPFSTGVIMEPLPVDRILRGLPQCVADLREDNWLRAAEAIMTTDTVPKAASRRLRVGEREVTLTGIAKGAGMIHPDMATMLSFVATDAAVAPGLLRGMLAHACEQSFNAITVDGDTSTNDSFVLAATGASGVRVEREDSVEYRAVRDALADLSIQLAQAIVRDGGGDQVHTCGWSRVRSRGMPQGGVRHRALAAGQDRLFAGDPNLGASWRPSATLASTISRWTASSCTWTKCGWRAAADATRPTGNRTENA
jgi:glutamate N-acetyltransferase/amino-acid N-acetyltransferase